MRHDTPIRPWDASWIWSPGEEWTVNAHLLARKEFDLPHDAVAATLRISAYTDYKLFVNGACVGRGPMPGDPYRFQSFDTYDVTRLLTTGRNVIAVICHNYGLGVHWYHRGCGGMIAQLDIDTVADPVSLGTDGTWTITRASAYRSTTPRMFWASGFMETFDARQADDRWQLVGFDDSGWERPAVQQATGRPPLEPREIAHLSEVYQDPVSIERGRFTVHGIHAVSFDAILPPGQAGLVYAHTDVYVDDSREVILHLECDDACKVFVNEQLVIEQNYDEEFARTRVWQGLDEYEQVHDGMGPLGHRVTVLLTPGWNSLMVVVDHGPRGWGFVLVPRDPATGCIIDLPCGPGHEVTAQWAVAGPYASTGMNDSLDTVVVQPSQLPSAATGGCNPFDYTRITDYATLMACEQRDAVRTVSGGGALTVHAGDVCIVDLGAVRVGYPVVDVTASDAGILDIGYSQTLPADRGIRFSNDGRMKYVDRVYLRPGVLSWQPLQRRTGRYVHLSCRDGAGITLNRVGFLATSYPVEEIGRFACSDDVCTDIWEVSRYTTRLLMQNGYQDCLKREESTLNESSFNYASRAVAHCYGDFALARQGLRLALKTQNESGWFHGHGISSPNSDEPTECLWWAMWLKDYYMYSGDREFVVDVFPHLEDNLRYFAKAINRHGLLDGRNWAIFRPGQIAYVDDAVYEGPYVGYFGGELVGDNILYGAALQAAAYLASELALDERASMYQRKALRVRHAINTRLWDHQNNRYADWRKGDTLASRGHPIFAIAALYFDLPNEEQTETLLRYLCDDLGLPDEHTTDYPLRTFGFYYYFLEILFRHGRDEMAFALLRRCYGRWLEVGATTFGEFLSLSDLKGKDTLDKEYEVHGYGTSAHLHFYTNVLGIRPLAPGFTRVLVAPHPGDLRWADGDAATPQGQIHVQWRISDATFVLDVEMPPSVTCNVQPPDGFEEYRIHVNGAPVTYGAIR